MTVEKKNEKARTIVIDNSEKMDTNADDILNVGYGILKRLYKELELDKFWNWKTRNLSVKFSIDQIFRLLVFSRFLCPASQKGTFDNLYLQGLPHRSRCVISVSRNAKEVISGFGSSCNTKYSGLSMAFSLLPPSVYL